MELFFVIKISGNMLSEHGMLKGTWLNFLKDISDMRIGQNCF